MVIGVHKLCMQAMTSEKSGSQGDSPALSNGRDRRRSPRRLLMSSGTIRWAGKRHLGLVRDLSHGGIYIYSHFVPSVGDQIEVSLVGESSTSVVRGTVLRVLSPAPGAATGVAVRIDPQESLCS